MIAWSVVIAALLVSAAVGTAAVSAMMRFGLHYPAGASYGELFRNALRTALPITLIVGSITTAYEVAKGRREATELELQTQRLERERAEKLAAESQLASLTSRVQPHFLFNTLNSVSELIHKDPARAEETIERLASLLRSSLDSAQTIPLETELELVTDYLEIQRTRFGERLRYSLDVPSDSGAGTVPPFAVQTVVENAVKHVGGSRQQGVALQLSARRAGGDLVIDVTDDGPGFGPDSMKAGHGLDNLLRRLRALYGENAALEFHRGAGIMTVRLRVPA